MSISDLYRASGLPGIAPGQPERALKQESLKNGSGPSDFQQQLETQFRSKEPTKVDGSLNFSQHAESRIKSRAIPWDDKLEARIKGGLDTAHAKGSREALILAGDVAVIANVKSRTIVTAMDRGQMKERIFTNIDSAVLV